MAPQGQRVDQLFWDLGANTVPLVAGVGRAQKAIKALAASVLTLKGGLIALGAIGALAFLKATSAAAKLDKPLREVSTLLPQTVEDMKGLRDEIVALSTRVPQPPEQLTKGLYQVISAGVTDAAEAMMVLEVAATAATAGLANSQDAVLAITTVLNAFQLEASESGRVSDVFFKTIAQGVITFPEIASSIGDMATTAALAGVSVEEMGAALATMTKAGINAAEASTSLNRLFLEIVEGSIGDEFNLAAVEANGFASVINKLADATQGDVKALQTLVPELRAFRSASVIAGNQNEEFNRILGETENSAGSTQTAFDKMNGSLQNQATLLKNRLGTFWLNFGTVTLPLVIAAVETLNRLLGATPEISFAALTGEQLQQQIDEAQQGINEARQNLADLASKTGTRSTIESRREERREELRLIEQRGRLLEEQSRRRAAEPPERREDVATITDEIQSLRDQLAVQLQDELVAITASAVDDMELEFQRLRDTIIKAFGEVPEEWQVILDEMRDSIEDTLTAEVAESVAKLREDLGKLRRLFGAGGIGAPVTDLSVDIDELADRVFFLTRAFAELGQGFGVFGRDAASAINSIATIGEGVKGLIGAIGTGGSLAGPIGAIAGGLGSLGGLVFGGPSEAEVERLRVLKANNEALERLTRQMEASAARGETSGALIEAGIRALSTSVVGVSDLPLSGFTVAAGRRKQAGFTSDIEESLAASGFTLEQLQDLAERWGITLDGTAASWRVLLEAMQAVETADLFEGFAGGMRRMRIEWELTDTIDPVKRLEAARKEFERLAGIAAPRNADEILEFWNRLQAGDTDVLGDLSPNQLIEFLQLFEGLLDETAGAAGATTSFAVSRSITEVTGNRIAGILTTDVFWNQQTALNTAGILDALGGTQGSLQPPVSMNGGPTDVTIIIEGSRGDPVVLADAVRDAFLDNVDRGLGERGRDTRRSRGNTLPTAV